MRGIAVIVVSVAIATAACGGTSSASNCREYAAEVDALLAGGADAAAIQDFLADTEEHVARLISDDPNSAGPCADAVFAALFETAFDDLEAEMAKLTAKIETGFNRD